MAYRIGKDVTFRQMYIDMYRFMREMTSISEVNYESASGNGAIFELSAPSATSTTETWTLVCVDSAYPARFTVMGNLTGYTADAYVDTLYNNGILQFTIKDGTQAWALNDIVSFSTKAAVYPEWTPRTICPNGDISRPPLYVKGMKQKTPQYGSEWLAPQRGDAYYITGPKNGSCAMRPHKKARYGYTTDNRTGSQTNYFAIGGPYSSVASLGNTDANAPTDFTLQLWVKDVFHARQNNYGPSYGEVLYSTVDYNVVGGTLSVQLQNGQLRIGQRYQTYMGASRYNYTAFRWNKDFSMENYLSTCGKSMSDWFLVTVVVDKATNTISVYLDKQHLGDYTTSYISQTRPVLGGIGSFGDVADPVIWRGKLSQSQIDTSYDSSDATNAGAPEIYDAFTWDEATTLPVIDMENKDNLGNIHTVQMYPNGYPYYSYRYDALKQSSVARTEDAEIQHMNSMYSGTTTHQWHNKGTSPRVYTLGAHPTDTIIDKYWVVATNEYVVMVFKIFDQSTVQQLPVYQTLYLGRGDSLQDKLYTTVVGTRNTGNDYWYTGSADFKSGFYYQHTCNWYGQYRWQVPTRIGAPSKRANYVQAGNSYNVWAVYHSQHYNSDIPSGRGTDTRAWAWEGFSVYYGYGFSPEEMGTFYGVYGIQALDTTPEDIVIIDGIEHLAYTDCTQSGQNSMLLLRLE